MDRGTLGKRPSAQWQEVMLQCIQVSDAAKTRTVTFTAMDKFLGSICFFKVGSEIL